MEQLLIIEDDIGLNQGLCKALKADDRQIISCHDLKAAREQLLCGGVSLILLDINLPDGSGLELLREVKENMPGVPVILLTANDTDLDIVDGLERGADDYITKPFSLSVLRARVNTQLRKQASNHKNAPFHMDLFHFDFEAMTFYVGDSKVELSKTEQKLLRLLVENRGRTMTRGDLVDRIWTDGAEYVDENALSTIFASASAVHLKSNTAKASVSCSRKDNPFSEALAAYCSTTLSSSGCSAAC